MKILIDIPTEQYNEIVYVNYEQLRDIVRDGVVIEKCEDTISREAAINLINHSLCDLKRDADKQIFINTINSLPSVQPQIESSEDCISRSEVHGLIATWLSNHLSDATRVVLEIIDGKVGIISPVTPQRPQGHWIFKNDNIAIPTGYYQCSECKEGKLLVKDNFCPNCGAEMMGGGEE